MKTMTLFIIFICDYIRQGNYPRLDGFRHTTEFADLPYVHGSKLGERYVYEGRALTAEEFNAAQTKLFDPDFRGAQGFHFQSMAIEVEADGAPAAETDSERFKRLVTEIEADPRLQELLNDRVADLVAKLAPQGTAEEILDRAAAGAESAGEKLPAEVVVNLKVDTEPEGPPDTRKEGEADPVDGRTEEQKTAQAAPGFKPAPADDPEAGPVEPVFSLRGKLIYDGDTKIGELSGEAKKLRVITQYKDLRPKIETWLATQNA